MNKVLPFPALSKCEKTVHDGYLDGLVSYECPLWNQRGVEGIPCCKKCPYSKETK